MERKKASNPNCVSYTRLDGKNRRVVVTLGSKKDKLFKIRICTYFDQNLKFKEDYYKNDNPQLFEQILQKEREYLNYSDDIRKMIAG